MTTTIKHQPSPERDYYENETLWAQDFERNPEERARIDAVSATIPIDVQSVLDVGCGNGAFLRRLEGRYRRLCGVDRSETALRFVHAEKRIASADDLPFDDGEFDLVTCMEVIEHLPQDSFHKALDELLRVSARCS
jgi:2-polyprenyl-3-methyl-5-hydroxy-6-metoxy-1,4-benzoquinol methylase